MTLFITRTYRKCTYKTCLGTLKLNEWTKWTDRVSAIFRWTVSEQNSYCKHNDCWTNINKIKVLN